MALSENSLRIVKEINDYCGVTEWHSLGYTGKGITVWDAENLGSHGRQTRQRILDAAPDCTVVNGSLSIHLSSTNVVRCGVYNREENKTYNIDEWIKLHNVKIVTRSLDDSFGDEDTIFAEYWKGIMDKYNLITFNSAGNDGNKNRDYSKRIAYLVGAVDKNYKGEIVRESYSTTAKGIDFADFAGWNNGTSFSTPYLAGKVALILQRYGSDLNRHEIYDILKSCCMDLYEEGEDNKVGWGIPILTNLKYEKPTDIVDDSTGEPDNNEDIKEPEPIEEYEGNENDNNPRGGSKMLCSGKLVKNFSLSEMACKDKNRTLVFSPELVEHAQRMQKLREWYNKPMIVNSWYRTEEYNKSVGGSSKSQHLKGTATDVALPAEFKTFTVERKREWITNMREKWHSLCNGGGGFGLYDTFIHIDSREVRTDFDYRKNKNY